MEKYKDKSWLKTEHGRKGKSTYQIGEECGVSHTTIWRWVNKYNIRKKTREEVAKEDPLEWSRDISYLTGLIASDGCLKESEYKARFTSKDKGLVKQFRKIIEDNFCINNNVIWKDSRGDNVIWGYGVTVRRLYYFLKNIGLTENKSLTLGRLDVPNRYFLDFLRGFIDGDGSWYLRNNTYLTLTIYSGSKDFLQWVSNKLDKLNLVNGFGNVHYNKRCYQLSYSHNDSKQIVRTIYKCANYYLHRKYNIVKEFI